MIVGIHDLENHFFVGAIETKMPIINPNYALEIPKG
jgi:hypothetical protein